MSRGKARRAAATRFGTAGHHATARRLGTALLGAGLLLTFGAMTAAAEPGGYGPVAPAAAREVGWAKSVLVTRTVAESGETLAATQDGLDVALEVPAGAFTSPVQVTLYRLAATDIAGSLQSGEDLVAGWSVTVTSPEGGTLAASEAGWQGLRLHVRGDALGLSGQVVRYFGGAEPLAPTDALQPGDLDLELSSANPGGLVISSGGADSSTTAATRPSPTGTPIAPVESVSNAADTSSLDLSTAAAVVVGGALVAAGGVLAHRRGQRR